MNDINWSSSDRLWMSGIAALLGGAGGYIGGLQVFVHYLQPVPAPLATLRELPGFVWHVVTAYGFMIPMPEGWVPSVSAAAGAVAAGALGWIAATRQNERHLRGFQLQRNPRAIAKAMRSVRGEPAGVHVHPAVQISQSDECKHIVLVGGTGAGKTTILWPILEEARARGDRMLIFDSKGDFTSRWPDETFALLSPTDSRGGRWRLGHDIQTRLEAQAVAETLIQASEKEPMWGQGARALLVGIISDLQAKKGAVWGLNDLAEAVAAALSDFESLKSIIAREDPMSMAYLGGEDAKGIGRTTAGFLSNLASSMTHVINLGVSAADLQTNREWSVRSWLAGKQPPVAMMGYRASTGLMSRAWCSSVIEQVVRQVSDLPDVTPDKRRIWLVLDEAPQAGKIPSITDALTTLRSKGVRVVLGIQSLAQIRETYSKDTATTWAGQCSIKIIGQLNSDEDQAWGSKILGDREVERFSGQVSMSQGSPAAQRNQSFDRVTEPVLMPASFGRDLKIIKGRGPRALMIAGGEAAVLDWPFAAITEHRPARVAARWIKPGFNRAAWGRVPPKVAGARDADTNTEQKAWKAKQQPQDRIVNAREQKPARRAEDVKEAEGQVIDEHAQEKLLDAALPGAGLAAKILGIVIDAAPAAGELHATLRQAQPQQQREQAQEAELTDEPEPEADDELDLDE